VPKFNFHDPSGAPWRIRRWQPDRSGLLRWRIEQHTGTRWQLRAVAPTRKVAQERMTNLWAREENSRAVQSTTGSGLEPPGV
jgi:hypothetical protein